MTRMTADECRQFLLDVPRTAKVSTVRPDGRPHIATVWFDLEGDTLVFTAWHTSVKVQNIRRFPYVCILVDDEKPPFSWVQVEGTAEVIDDPDIERWAARMGGRYMGPELAEQFGKRNGVEGEMLVRVHVTRIIGEKNITD